jgi:serine/threonine-protein kinase ULK/ATG1
VEKKSLTKSSTENLVTEIEILKKLKHDHIVELKDFEVNILIVIFTNT